MTLTCPNCKLPHALFWRVGVKDRDLVYRCNRVEKFKDTDMLTSEGKPLIETRYGTGTIIVVDKNLIGAAQDWPELPEEWTASKRHAEQKKNQHQLLLMKHKEDRP